MKTVLVGSMFVLSAVSLSVSAEEFSWGDVNFQPRVYMGYSNYSLESGTGTFIVTMGNNSPVLQSRKLAFDVQGDSNIHSTGFLGGLGATVATGHFFGDIYYQSSLNETVYSSQEQTLSSNNINALGDVDAQHSDWAISLGYRINEQWSVFAGYKSGKTEWDQSFQTNRPAPDSRVVQDGNYNLEFEQDGPFIGTAYSFLIGPGALTIKAAYAYLDGTHTADFNSVCRPPNDNCPSAPIPVLQRINLSGNSNAFSFGLSWTQSLADNLGLSIGANYQQYEFDTSGSGSITSSIGNSTLGTITVSDVPLTEELFTLTASLTYVF